MGHPRCERTERFAGNFVRTAARKAVWGLALGLLFACGADEPRESEANPLAIEDRDIGSTSAALSTRQRFFGVTRDVRRCASPLCGGYFVTALNQAATVCADGRRAESCYVASIDWGALGGDPQLTAATLVVEGEIRAQEYPNFGNLGVLVAADAWGSANATPAAGEFFRLGDSGIRCITAPCFSIDGERLNRGTVIQLSDLDLSLVGATPAQIELAYRALAEGTLLASGRLRWVRYPTGLGRELVASQFYLPRAHRECQVDEDCPAGAWCRQRDSGGMECVPFVGEGASCGGFRPPSSFERCAPGLTCDTSPFLVDAPGICRASCETSADCKSDQYCASDSLCHADGSCDFSVDCNLDGNSYPHIECVGYGVCPEFQNQCGWQCGNPACLDLSGYDFGPCDAVLGVGVLDGACATLSGCSADGFTLFASESECAAACNL